MAANYWTSTQRRFWLFTDSQLASIRSSQMTQNNNALSQYPLPDRRHILIFLKEQLLRLSRRLPTRQQCLATTLVYIHRYLLTHPLQNVNPYLLLTTAIYLASKTEESPHHIRVVLGEARQFWPEFVPGDVSRIGEMEFSLISEMRSQLIIWHPYRTLMELRGPKEGAEGEDQGGGLDLTPEEANMAWNIVNDSYLTDLPLTCPPHVIAIMAIFVAVALQPSVKAPIPGRLPARFPLPNNPNDVIANNSPSESLQGLGGRQGISAALSSSLAGGGNADGGKVNGGAPIVASERMQQVIRFLAQSTVNLEQVINASQEILSLYEVWETYSERGVRDALTRVIRARGLDK